MAINSDNTLIWLEKYFEKKFGAFGYNSCLFTAIARIVIKETGMKDSEFVRTFSKYDRKPMLLDVILQMVSKTYKIGKREVEVKVTAFSLPRSQDVIHQLSLGKPAVMVYDSAGPMWREIQRIEMDDNSEGIATPKYTSKYNLHKSMEKSYGAHAVIVVGYDFPYDLLICRDSASNYSKNGYFKVPSKVVGKLSHCIGFNVETSAPLKEGVMSFQDFRCGYGASGNT